MASLCFPLTVFLLDSSLSYIAACLVYRYYTIYFLDTVWLVYLSKAPVLGAIALKLPCPRWTSSALLYTLTLCLVPPLYQTLRFLLTSQAPELHSGLSHTLLYHLPLSLSCLVWDLASSLIISRETPSRDDNENQSDRKNFIRLLKYSKADWLPLSLAFTFLALELIFEMLIPYCMGRMIDVLSTNYKETEFFHAMFLMAIFTMASSLSAGCRVGLFTSSMSGLTRRLRIHLFHALIKQDIGFFETSKTGTGLSYNYSLINSLQLRGLSLVWRLSEMTHSAGGASKVFQYLDREPLVSTSGSHCPDNLRGEFEFKNVTFSYPTHPGAPILQNVSFTLPPGTVTALVGPSGGGKTTCVSLLERFYEPQGGEILLDGRPIADYKHQFLHSKVALVAQTPVLFSGTIKENITYGLRDPTEQRLRAAAREAKADFFISDLGMGYDTDVDSSGDQLGAGQKQRVALARALALRPRLLILDEASSNLDVDTEHEIQQSLQSTRGLSLLIISHRLRTIRDADQILVLAGGRIVERGTHEDLVRDRGTYHRLLQNGD